MPTEPPSRPHRPRRFIDLRRARWPAALAALMIVGGQVWAQDRPHIDVPVMVGGEVGWDACGSGGTVMGLDPNGDGFLSVRSGPGGRPFSEMDRVFNGQRVAICDKRGPWYAVVYAPGSGIQGCGISTEVRTRIPYTGPCRYGWIHSRYVGDLAD